MDKIFYSGSNFDLTDGFGLDYLEMYSVPNTPGFKFTMSAEAASFDASIVEKSPYFKGENITPVTLDIKNPIYVDENGNCGSTPFTMQQIHNIITKLPRELITEFLNDFHGEVSPSGKGYKKFLNEAVSAYAGMDAHYAIECLKNDFFSNYDEQEFLEIIKECTTYDCIVRQEVAGHINVFMFSTSQVFSAFSKDIDNLIPMVKKEKDVKYTEDIIEVNQVELLIEAASHYKTFKEFMEDVLFHGTSEDIVGDLQGGGDNVLWAAERNDIAQNYITLAESISSYNYPDEGYEMNRTANVFDNKSSFDIKLLEQFGYEFSFIEDEKGICSVSCTLNGREAKLPKKKDVADILTNKLNYPKTSYMLLKRNAEGLIAPYNYKMQGRLYVLLGKNKLKIEDIRKGYFNQDNPQYHELERFRKLEDKGVDAVIIDDTAQSNNHGDLDHDGYALFASALNKMDSFIIPARNFDWDYELEVDKTPEFCLKDIFDKSRLLLKNEKGNTLK